LVVKIIVPVFIVAVLISGFFVWQNWQKLQSLVENQKENFQQPKVGKELITPTNISGEILIYSLADKEMTVQAIGESKVGNLTEMLIWTDNDQEKQWKPFQTLTNIPTSDNVYAQFKDDHGNISVVYSDSVFPKHSPPDSNQ